VVLLHGGNAIFAHKATNKVNVPDQHSNEPMMLKEAAPADGRGIATRSFGTPDANVCMPFTQQHLLEVEKVSDRNAGQVRSDSTSENPKEQKTWRICTSILINSTRKPPPVSQQAGEAKFRAWWTHC
jgi:hypothetical protein